MPLDTDFIIKLAAPVITTILAALLRFYFEGKSRLVSYISNVSTFTLKGEEKDTHVFTHQIVISNTGRKSANNVRLGHAFLPENINIIPPVKHSIERSQNGTNEITIPVLVPKEQVTISYLYFPPLTWDKINSYTKSDEGLAKIINVIPMPQPPKAIIFLVWGLMFLGASLIIYILLLLLTHTQ